MVARGLKDRIKKTGYTSLSVRPKAYHEPPASYFHDSWSPILSPLA